MKRGDIIFTVMMALTVIAVLSYNNKSYAAEATTSTLTKPAEINSVGRLEIDGDGSGVVGDHPSDVIIDADDFYYLWELCQ